jgi:CHAD domain-containing protein
VTSAQQLSSPPGFRLPDLDDVAEGVGAEVLEPITLESTYHDTPELRLARAGTTLRHRSDEGWLVRFEAREDQRGAPGNELADRGEHRFDADASDPPGAALDLVRALVRTAHVAPVARLRTRRRRIELHDESGKPLGEVTDDEVSVLKRGRVAARFRELEVSVDDAAPDGLADAVVARLRAAGAGPPDPTPKIVHALGWRALDAPDVVALNRLGPDPTAGDVLRGALSASVAQVIERDAGVRLGDEPEDVHQARVATRRLRSTLRTFSELLHPEWTASLSDELRSLGRDLGAVRDNEVLLNRLRARAERLRPDDQDAAKRLLNQLVERWDEARSALQDTLRGREYTDLLDRLVGAAREPPLLPEADAPAGEVLPPLVRKQWENLQAAVEALEDDPPDESLHDVRIRAKRCRYAAETVTPIAGKEARNFARAMKDLQDVLGEHQDAVVAEAWLRDIAAKVDGVEMFVAGELASMERLDGERTRHEWPDAWRKASRKRLRQWF